MNSARPLSFDLQPQVNLWLTTTTIKNDTTEIY